MSRKMPASAVLQRRNPAYTHRKATFRPILLAVCAGYFLSKALQPHVLQWGGAVDFAERLEYKAVDYANQKLLDGFQKIYPHDPTLMRGPETVLVGPEDTLYTLTEDANLVELRDLTPYEHGMIINATAVVIKDLGMGRPLGGRFTKDGTLYVADAVLGLTRVEDIHDPSSKVEIVLSQIGGTPIRFADDVVIGPKSGNVYFSDATSIAPNRVLKRNSWDALYSSQVDLLRGNPTGRVIEYNPKTDEARVLLENVFFANGIGVDPEERFLLIGETFGPKLIRYDIAAGTASVAVQANELPGYPDGVDCSATHCFSVLPSAVTPIHKLVAAVPGWLSVALRTCMMVLPKCLAPPPSLFGAVVQYTIATKETQMFLDPTGKTVSGLTGVTVHENKLYLGSLHNDYIGVFEPKA